MTRITLQGDMAVIRDGKVGTERRCCCCTPCERCSYGCLSLTLSGLNGAGGSECDECEKLNGTYTLVRGGGVPPSIFVEAQSSSGTGAVLTATLDFSKSKGTYSVGKITIEKAGSGYNQDVTLAYTVVDGIVACNDPPVLSAIAEPIELFIDQATDTSPAGSGAVLRASLVPAIDTQMVETWGLGPVTVVNGGSNYDDGASVQVKVHGSAIEIKAAEASLEVDVNGTIKSVIIGKPGEYLGVGGLTSAKVTNPGTIWPVSSTGGASAGSKGPPGSSNSMCEFSLCEETECVYEDDEKKCRRISLLIGEEEHRLTVTVDGGATLEAKIPAADTSCDNIKFPPGSITNSSCTPSRSEPTFVSVVPDPAGDWPPAGTGAALQPSIVPVVGTQGAETWGIGSVSVANGGLNYDEGVSLKITVGDDTVVVAPAFASIRVDHSQPEVDTFAVLTESGTGATFSPTWAIDQDLFDEWTGLDQEYDGRWWYIESLSITNGGSGYEVGNVIGYTLKGTNKGGGGEPTTGWDFLASVSSVDETGAITGINVDSLGPGPQTSHYKTTGTIQSVYVNAPGQYYGLSAFATVSGGECGGAPDEDACCRECSRCIRNGEWDCQYTTKESCESCTRIYTCHESLQTECDGDCPDGFTPDEPPTVRGVEVKPKPGCGYTAYGLITVGCGKVISATLDPAYHNEYSPASGFAKLGRIAPTVTATVTQSGGSASGAVLAVNLTQSTDYCGYPYWYIDSITVVSPGSGYTIDEPEGNAEITLEDAPGDIEEGYGAYAYVTEVDEDGGIVSVYVSDSNNRWHESATATPILTPVTVEISGYGSGSGAVVTPVIDTDTSSPTFGHITSFTVDSGGSGYVSLCSRTRLVESCDECLPRQSPESSNCVTSIADDGKPCGEWTPGFPCVEPPCCDSCLVLPNPPYPPSPTRTCVPTLNVEENTSGYEKSSSISSGPPDWYGALPWAEGWLDEHDSCTFVWVEDFVIQTNETGTYCQDYVWPGSPGWGGGNLPDGYTPLSPYCYIHSLVPGWIYCRGYAKKYWTRFRLFLVDCRDRSISEVTDAALAGPVEFSGCIVDVGVPIGAAQNEAQPLCNPPNCNGANPGFLDAQPTLECAE